MPAEADYTGHILRHVNGPIMNPRTPPSRTTQAEQEGARATEERSKPCAGDEPGAGSFLFDDPYWDDAFDSYHSPTLRTCCGS